MKIINLLDEKGQKSRLQALICQFNSIINLIYLAMFSNKLTNDPNYDDVHKIMHIYLHIVLKSDIEFIEGQTVI